MSNPYVSITRDPYYSIAADVTEDKYYIVNATYTVDMIYNGTTWVMPYVAIEHNDEVPDDSPELTGISGEPTNDAIIAAIAALSA
jgi:hypothetical protein